jgi:hypothetical protein
VQVDQVLVFGCELLGWYGVKGAVKIVDALEQVFGESLQGEVARRLDLAFRLLLKIAVLGDLPF